MEAAPTTTNDNPFIIPTILLVVRNRFSGQAAERRAFSATPILNPVGPKFRNDFFAEKSRFVRGQNPIQKAGVSAPFHRVAARAGHAGGLSAGGDHGFTLYDDNDYVTENPMVQNGLTWAGVKWAFTTWHASNWHPLTWLSHMADCQLFGLNPAWPHAVNVLFHAANAVLLLCAAAAADAEVVASGRARSSPRCSPGIRCTSNPSRGSPSARMC